MPEDNDGCGMRSEMINTIIMAIAILSNLMCVSIITFTIRCLTAYFLGKLPNIFAYLKAYGEADNLSV